jgi:hypothetical protein
MATRKIRDNLELNDDKINNGNENKILKQIQITKLH